MSAFRRTTGDSGTAAVELALLSTVLLSLVALVAPVCYLLIERVQLGRAAGDTIRFASSRSDQDRTVGSITVPAKQLPGSAAVVEEQRRAYSGRGRLQPGTPVRARDATCSSGRRVTVSVETVVDLGPFLGLLIPNKFELLRATATSCEE